MGFLKPVQKAFREMSTAAYLLIGFGLIVAVMAMAGFVRTSQVLEGLMYAGLGIWILHRGE